MAFADLRLVRGARRLAQNSPWLLIALGLHVIVAALMSVLYIRHEMQKANAAPTEIAVNTRPPEPAPELIQPEPDIVRDKIPDSVPFELMKDADVQTFVPTADPQEEKPEDLYKELRNPTGSDEDDDGMPGGTSIGVGHGGHYGSGTPGLLGARVGKGKHGSPDGWLSPLPQQGTEGAVFDGLCWLARHQNADGSWGADTLAQHCNPRSPCIPADAELDSSYDVGMTALALLAFLGEGDSVTSRGEMVDTAVGKRHFLGEIVKRGVKWLMQRQKPDGSFSDSQPFEYPENETLATMALCEAYALSHVREIRRPAQNALDFLVAAQKRDADGAPSGWGLGSRADIETRHASGEIDDDTYAEARASLDLSITCWVVMALKSAQTCGFKVPEESLRGALGFSRALTAQRAASEAERDPKDEFVYHAARVSALGMLIRSFVAQDISDPYLETAAKEIAADLPRVTKDGRSVDFYYWYFATLALNQFDGPDSPRKGAGKYWTPWNAGLVDSLLALQNRDKTRDACARGGWLQAARGNRKGLALYNTALNVLTLEVYYRFANVFGAGRPR